MRPIGEAAVWQDLRADMGSDGSAARGGVKRPERVAGVGKTLRPANCGVGFKAIFAGDQAVVDSGITYGIQLSGFEDFSQVWTAGFDQLTAGAATSTPNQKTVVIKEAISKDNHSRWDADLYGSPFITVNGQTYYGKTVTVNMKDMAASALTSGDQNIVDAVNAMMKQCEVSVS